MAHYYLALQSPTYVNNPIALVQDPNEDKLIELNLDDIAPDYVLIYIGISSIQGLPTLEKQIYIDNATKIIENRKIYKFVGEMHSKLFFVNTLLNVIPNVYYYDGFYRVSDSQTTGTLLQNVKDLMPTIFYCNTHDKLENNRNFDDQFLSKNILSSLTFGKPKYTYNFYIVTVK